MSVSGPAGSFVKDILRAMYGQDMLGATAVNDSIANVVGQMLWENVRDKWWPKWPRASTGGSKWGAAYVERNDVRNTYYNRGGKDHFTGPWDGTMARTIAWKWRGALDDAKMSGQDAEYHSAY